jgi:hypothetical protein
MTCVNGGWDTDGCTTVLTEQDQTNCECSRFGSYTVVAEMIETPWVKEEAGWLKVIKYTGFFFSIPSLLVLVVIVAISQ